MAEPVKILCVDDEVNILRTLQRLFRSEDWEVLTAASADEALALLVRTPVQVVLSDFRMPGRSGVDLLREVHRSWPDTVGIILSGHADISAVTQAMEEEIVFCFVPKPWDRSELKETVAAAIALNRLRSRASLLGEERREATLERS